MYAFDIDCWFYWRGRKVECFRRVLDWTTLHHTRDVKWLCLSLNSKSTGIPWPVNRLVSSTYKV